jgi:hypothetical protein
MIFFNYFLPNSKDDMGRSLISKCGSNKGFTNLLVKYGAK